MDPFTQGVVGAAFGQLKGSAQTLAKAAIIGALAGMAADLDILIRSSEDPLLALQFHRHFSHSLLFIPIGALLCTVFFHYAFAHRRWGFSFNQTYSWSLIGYATHALLDGCTSYGTQLLWPLSNHRFAWDFIAVIDPAFTLPAFILVLTAAIKKQRRWALMAIGWMALYMALASWQHRASSIEHPESKFTGGEKILSCTENSQWQLDRTRHLQYSSAALTQVQRSINREAAKWILHLDL